MIKREKKLSIPTLNRLNEEDENILVDNQESNISDINKYKINKNQHINDETESNELAIDKKKMLQSIDTVFKMIPFCESSNILLDDRKRLESLEQVLINRLTLNYEDNIVKQNNQSKNMINTLSSSQYGIYLASSFDTNLFKYYLNQHTEKNSDSKLENESIINLNNLNLTTECLNTFSIKSLLAKTSIITEKNNLSDDKLMSIQNEDYLNLINNSKKIRILNLTNNSLKRLPIQLLNMFENLELINLSDNKLESINLIGLVKFCSLKEINLSNNYLKSFKSVNMIDEKNKEIDNDDNDVKNQKDYNFDSDDLSNPLFFRIERLDLANNQLKSSNCLIISKFENLKYLNLSNNLFQINASTADAQLPWLKSKTKLKNLIELNLSKNNKYNYDTVCASATSLRNVSSLSNLSINTNKNKCSSSTSFNNNYAAYTSFRAPNNEFFSSDKSQLSNNSSFGPSRLASSVNMLSTFNCLTNLRKLDLSENSLINMPNDIKDLKYLEELNLSKNKLMFIPNELTELKHLKCLLLSDNNLTELSETFCTYANFKHELIVFDLSKNQITYENFSSRIGLFESLIEINLSDNLFDSIPNTLPKNLEYLNLSKNKLKSLMTKPMSESIYNDGELLIALNMNEISKQKNKHLFKSSISSHRTKGNQFFNTNKESLYDQPDIDQFDQLLLPHVFFLRNLKILHLRDNHIQDVPSDFGILNSNLEFIDISSNLLTQLSVSLCRGLGNSLRYLDLSSNRIREITDKLRELGSVEYLNLSHNQISKLNFEICNDLKSLKELYLNNNNIEELPLFTTNSSLASIETKYNKSSSFGLKHSTTAENENSSESSNDYSNKTKTSTKTVIRQSSSTSDKQNKFTFNLPNLKKLDLSNNKLKETFSIYSSFALSQNLIEINLSSNKIKLLDMKINEKKNAAWTLELFKRKNQPIVNEDQIRKLRMPTYRLNNLESIDLSNNDIRYLEKGGFIKFLCEMYKFAPKLNKILYDQLNGAKLGEPQVIEQTIDILNESISKTKKKDLINDEFYFDFDEYNNEDDFFFEVNDSILNDNILKRNGYYETLLNKLRIIDLSNNNLKSLPKFIFELKNLKEIYFNGNLLNKIPNEMYKLKNDSVLDDEDNFESLKRLQELRIKAEYEALTNENSNDLEDENHEEQEKILKNNRKSKKKKFKNDEPEKKEPSGLQKNVLTTATTSANMKLISDTVEIIHFNNNSIEYIPENLFSNFKNLKEIQLLNNPLKEPPLESVCISSRFVKNKVGTELIEMNADKTKNKYSKNDSNNNHDTINFTLLNKNKTKKSYPSSFNISNTFSSKDLSDSILPNLFFETNENLKPLQSYMLKYKNREDMLLCNMFLMVKDNIDSIETLMKLMRRLKMPMDRVDFVCKEIEISVSKNWKQISAIEFSPQPGKLSLSQKALLKKMNQYTLRLQTWNLLNAWRNMNGIEAQSDELIRVFKLMSSNEYESEIYNKLLTLKLTSNVLRL